MTMADPILDGDLDAYVDDQLPVARRIAVEAYLSERPDIAARVMADLRVRDELRLALASARSEHRPETREAARRLERALSFRPLMSGLRRAATVALFIGVGWAAHSSFGPLGAKSVVASEPAPAFVEEAVRAHATAKLREGMASQAEKTKFDATEIRAATGIVLPELPKGWRVTDSQIFPSAFGPSVELAITPEDGGRLSLFAVRPGSFAVEPVALLHAGPAEAAYWQIGEVAYALVSDTPHPDRLDETAQRIARALY